MVETVPGSLSGSTESVGRAWTRFDHLDLQHQLGDAVWLGRADDEVVTARIASAAAFDTESPERDAGLRRVEELASLRSPHLVPLVGVAERNDAVWLVSEHVEGVPLSRLLSTATLTPVQAGYVAVRLLQGVAHLHEAGVAHGRLTDANVVVGVDGEPRLTDWAVASLAHARGFDETAAEDVAAARGLVAGLARNADRPVVRHHSAYGDLMAALERIGRGDGNSGAAESAAQLDEVLLAAVGDATSMAGPRAEIGAVVTTLVRRSTGVAHPVPPQLRTAVPVPAMLPTGRLSEADWHLPRRHRWLRLGLALAVIAALLGGGYAVGREPAGKLLDRFLGRDQSTGVQHTPDGSTPSSPSSPGTGSTSGPKQPTPSPVPDLGPARSGSVLGVTLRPLAACSPGSACLIRATARITSASESRQIDLAVSVVNRCTGKVRRAGAESVTAQPGWTSVYVTIPVELPRAGALAAVALTTAPDRAASPPLLVPATGGSC